MPPQSLADYLNNGRYDRWQWRWEHDLTPEQFAAHICGYATEGMNIVGGCCGVRSAHIAAARAALAAAQPAGR